MGKSWIHISRRTAFQELAPMGWCCLIFAHTKVQLPAEILLMMEIKEVVVLSFAVMQARIPRHCVQLGMKCIEGPSSSHNDVTTDLRAFSVVIHNVGYLEDLSGPYCLFRNHLTISK